MSSGLQVAGLASNFDWKSFVDQIINLERAPASRLETEQATNRQKVTLLSTLGTKLSTLQGTVQALKSDTLYGKRTAASGTADSTWKAAAANDTVTGTYAIAVSRLAAATKLAGAADIGAGLNPVSGDVSGLTLANLPIAQPVTAGSFTINGTVVTVSLTDSLQDVFDAIATATSGSVTGAYDHTTDTVSLTGSGVVMMGAANDTSNFLQAMKLVNGAGATVTSTSRLGTVKASAPLATANLASPITGVDGNGDGTFSINGVSIAYNINTDSLSAVIARINASSAGVSAGYDTITDRLTLTNKTTGDIGLYVNDPAGGFLEATGLRGGTTFLRGLDAQFTVNGGSTLTSRSNTLDAAAHGIAGLSVTVDSTTTQSVTVASDTAALREKIEKFITDFNEVQKFIDANTRVSSDSKGKVTAAPLSGNREIQEWATSLRRMAFAAVSGLTGTVDRLEDLGLDFRAGTSELEIEDSAKLDTALQNAGTDVKAFFTTATTGFGAKLETYVTNLTEQNDDQQDRINQFNNDLDEQIANIERHLEQRRALLESAFIRMEEAQQKLKQQQTSLENMFAQSKS
ncbi:MAG: flagellar filament capping protein FliD [Opitutaceae bacterium]|nr:flagellar filament capping protein FliD [Opitutaceae bacterium]